MSQTTARAIPHSMLETDRRRAARAAEEAADFAEWLEGRSDLRLSSRPTGETATVWRQEPSDPTSDAYERSNQMGPVAREAREYSVTLSGVQGGVRDRRALGDYIQVPWSAAEAAREHLSHLQSQARRSAALVERLDREIAAGELIVSPTREEESAAARAEDRRREVGSARRKLQACRRAREVYIRDRAAYLAGGHDVDAHITSLDREIAEALAVIGR